MCLDTRAGNERSLLRGTLFVYHLLSKIVAQKGLSGPKSDAAARFVQFVRLDYSTALSLNQTIAPRRELVLVLLKGPFVRHSALTLREISRNAKCVFFARLKIRESNAWSFALATEIRAKLPPKNGSVARQETTLRTGPLTKQHADQEQCSDDQV